MRSTRIAERGLTLIEVLVVILFVAIGIYLPTLQHSNHGAGYRALKDSTQFRGISQAMVLFADENDGMFPLPSIVDGDSTTVPGPTEAKDTTANMFSALIMTGLVTPEMLISPSEVNGNIEECENYEFDEPSAAADPPNARWDPAFRADFTTGIGNVSYAHLMPSEDRMSLWRTDAPATTPIVGNRGPRVEKKGGELVADAESNTFLIHGGRKSWEGNIVFADGHADFLKSMTLPDGDHLFFDEEAPGNANLGIFVEAGKTRDQFKAIWD